MFKGKFYYESEDGRRYDIFGEMEKWFDDQKKNVTDVFKPKFIGDPDFMAGGEEAEDSATRCCFVFETYDKVDLFASKLSEAIDAKVIKGSFIGYRTIYVPKDKYDRAIEDGLDIILNDKSFRKEKVSWINVYNQKESCEYEKLLHMKLINTFIGSEGELIKIAEPIIKIWKERLEQVLDVPVLVKNGIKPGEIEFLVERKKASFAYHRMLLNKIRESEILELSPFSGYAYVSFYGKYLD